MKRQRQRLVVALLVGCGIIAAAAITSLAAFVSPAHAAETVTLEQQTDAVAELFRLKQRDGEIPKEYHFFMIGQHVSSNGKNAMGIRPINCSKTNKLQNRSVGN